MPVATWNNQFESQLSALRSVHGYRSLNGVTDTFDQTSGKTLTPISINLASNDYLDLSANPAVIKAAGEIEQGGARASRLVSGNLPIHLEFEEKLAQLYPGKSSLLYGSGYLANIGVISAVVGREDWVVSDRLIHASLIDGIRLSRAKHLRFHHNDCQSAEDCLRRAQEKRSGRGKLLLVVESVYSMDGDCAPLLELSNLAQKYQAMLLVDEAHALGVFGSGGQGLSSSQCSPDILLAQTATASKSLGSYGGFVVTSPEIRQYLINYSRSFIYTTGLAPSCVSSAIAALDLINSEPDIGMRLLESAEAFRNCLKSEGLNTLGSQSQIVPVLVGDREKLLLLSEELRARGIVVAAIREPSVAIGTARLRFSVCLAHSQQQLTAVAKVTAELARELGIV